MWVKHFFMLYLYTTRFGRGKFKTLSEMLKYHTEGNWSALLRSAISFATMTECRRGSKHSEETKVFVRKWFYIAVIANPNFNQTRERETNFTHNILP